jgi:hypothetical protein
MRICTIFVKVELKAPKTKRLDFIYMLGIPSLVPASNKLQPLETRSASKSTYRCSG